LKDLSDFHVSDLPKRYDTATDCALDVLLAACEPLISWEIAVRMLVSRGVTESSQKVRRDLTAGVHTSLRDHHGKTARRINKDMPVQWGVT
jgi:hypothetical protein